MINKDQALAHRTKLTIKTDNKDLLHQKDMAGILI